ncbi:MAG TPA: ABC transporter permease, partial [Nitrospirae bacterium]|nr:ABC transporter permease [Nitrospirota bacterium]
MRIFLYSLHTAIKNLWHEKWINFLTVMTVGVGLILLGTFILITLNMDSAIKRWSKGFGIVVYLNDDLSRDEEEELNEQFQKDPDIEEITYVSRAAALSELKDALGDKQSILQGFDKNPLPASFELKLRKGLLEPDWIRQKALEIKQMTQVEDVQYGEKWLLSLSSMTDDMKIIAILFGAVIFVAIAFASYSTIKILFYRRKDEIETLKLLGATRGFIRAPFLLEGFFIGLSGGIAGFLGLLS